MKLPPLNSLRAFEAAARHQSIVRAAEELKVTPGAISRHVKLLEDSTGVTLFRRRQCKVELTETGRRLLPVLSNAFENIRRVTEQLSSSADTVLNVSCPATIAIKWLMPRLHLFEAEHPRFRIRVSTEWYDGWLADEFDVAFVREHCNKVPDRFATQRLFPLLLTPLCAPGLLQSVGPLEVPGDLSRVTLLDEPAHHRRWQSWLEAFQVRNVSTLSAHIFPTGFLVASAAIQGKGVAVLDMTLFRDEIENGQLVMPFEDLICELDHCAICLGASPDNWDRPVVRIFRQWIEKMAMIERKEQKTRGWIQRAARRAG